MVITIIVLVLIAIICVFSVKSYKKKVDNGCCGGGSEKVRANKVKDKNKSHYPYTAVISIDGMVCGNCANHVENKLNELDGVWASVDLDQKEATVRMKEKISEDVLRKTVNDSGYIALRVNFG